MFSLYKLLCSFPLSLRLTITLLPSKFYCSLLLLLSSFSPSLLFSLLLSLLFVLLLFITSSQTAKLKLNEFLDDRFDMRGILKDEVDVYYRARVGYIMIL
jgi:hypothetical protein